MRIALIARHFPPAISGGVRRPAVLRESLMGLGHRVFVIAPRLAEGVDGYCVPHPAEGRDDSGISRPSTQRDPRWRRLQRDLLLWPDPDRWWANKVIGQAGAAIEAFAPDIIITTSPPESAHYVGLVLSQRLRCRWIADFRDSWLKQALMPERQRLLRRIGERRLARRWISQADLITAPTEFILKEMSELGKPRLTHLYPQLSLAQTDGPRDPLPAWDNAPDGTIRVLHTGSFSLSDPERRLQPVLDSFSAEAPDQGRLFIAGRLSEAEHGLIKDRADAVWLGLLHSGTSQRLQTEADALLLVASPGTNAVPGKLAEYVQAGVPIIVHGHGPWRASVHIPMSISFADLDQQSPTLARNFGHTLPGGSVRRESTPFESAIQETQKLLDALSTAPMH